MVIHGRLQVNQNSTLETHTHSRGVAQSFSSHTSVLAHYWCDPQNWLNTSPRISGTSCTGEGALLVMMQLMLQAPSVPTVVNLTWRA